MRGRDIAKGWDSDLGLSYIPKAELFGLQVGLPGLRVGVLGLPVGLPGLPGLQVRVPGVRRYSELGVRWKEYSSAL